MIVFATLFGLTVRRGATDPVCGMAHCLHAFEIGPDRHDHAAHTLPVEHAH